MADDNPVKEKSLEDIMNETVADHSTDLDVVSLGKSKDFRGEDVSRYMSYSTETWGKLGYDPYRDNSKIYNQNTHWSEDIQRAYTGMWNLAGVGFRDTFGFGAFAEEDSHKSFEQVMNTYSSTRGGATQFISNTMLSSGYTIGIISAIALEEALITLGTAGLGTIPGAAVGGTRIAQGTARAIDKTHDAVQGLNATMKFLKNIQNSRVVKGIGSNFKSFAKQLNPVGETADFIRKIDEVKYANEWVRTFQGAASLSRDARKIHMTMAESNLEANLARDETRDYLFNSWYAENPGEDMDERTRQNIEDQSNKVFNMTYNSNLGLIYATNAITFNTMFKSMRMTNAKFGLSQSGKFTVKGWGTPDVIIKGVQDNFKNYLKSKVANLTWKGAAKWTLTSSMEGVQEISQDFISGVAKRYGAGLMRDEFTGAMYVDERMRGSYYNSMMDSFGDMHAESFFSGMLMGTFAAPVSFSIEQTQKFLLGGGHQAITNRKAYEETKAKRWKEVQEDAEFLTQYFRESGTYLDTSGEYVYSQAKAQEEMAKAGEENDRKTFEDKRAESFRLGMRKILKHGLEQEYVDHLSQMLEYNAAELNESTGRNDINENNITEFKDKISRKIEEVKEFKAVYDETQKAVNPVSLKGVKPTDKDYYAKLIAHKAFENYRDEILFTKHAVSNLTSRLNDLDSKMKKNGSITGTDLKTLLDNTEVASEIALLEAEIKSDKEYNVKPEDRVKKERRLKALKSYQKAIDKFEKLDRVVDGKELGNISERTEAVHAEMFDAFDNLINSKLDVEGTTAQRVLNRKDFEYFWDYLINTRERNDLQKHANLLSDPEMASEYVKKTSKVLEDIDKNKKQHILNSLEAFHNQEVSNDMIQDLLSEGFFFDMNELDDLIQNGIMPSNLYNSKTNEPLTAQEAKLAQQIIEGHVKRLKNKKIYDKGFDYVSRKKSEKDKRTAKGIFRAFSGNKKDTPVNINTFIDRLLKSPRLTRTESDILNVIKTLGIAEGKVILTDSADGPITVNEDGILQIDVRFAASDYKNGNTPFEYLAVSALLQQHYAEQIKNSPALEAEVRSLMNKAKEAYVEKFGAGKSVDISLFKDPVKFLSEALNNVTFQDFLASVEDVESPETDSLWKTFMNSLRLTLGKLFKGSLLDRAVNLSQLALTDENIEQTLAGKEEEEIVEEEEDSEQHCKDLQCFEAKIAELEAEIAKRESEKGSFRFNLKNNFAIKGLKAQVRQLKDEMNALPSEEAVESKDNIRTSTETIVEETDDNGEVIIGKKPSFKSLPVDLQSELADLYLNKINYSEPKVQQKDKEDQDGNKVPSALEKAQNSFDAIKEDHTPPDSSINKLTDEDIANIEANLQTNPVYIAKVAEYNNKRLRSQQQSLVNASEPTTDVDVEEEVETTEDEDTGIELDGQIEEAYSQDDLLQYLPDISDFYSESEIEIILTDINTGDATLEEIADALAERKAEKADDDFNEIVENLKRNYKELDRMAAGAKIEINRTATRAGRLYNMSKEDVQLFKQQYPNALKASREEFVGALSSYILSTRNKAAMINKGMNSLINDENLYDNLVSLVSELKNQRQLSSRVIRAINKQLTQIGSVYTLKNTARQKRYEISFSPVRKKKVLRKDQKPTDNRSKLADFFLDPVGEVSPLSSISNEGMTYDQALFMVYDWLRKNKVHPDALGVDEKRTYTSKKSRFKTFDGIADIIFEEVPDALEAVGGPSIVEDVFRDFDSVPSLEKYLLNRRDEIFEDAQAETSDEDADAEERYYEDKAEKARADYYSSRAFLIESGLYDGNIENLTPEELKLYNSSQKAYEKEEDVLTPVEKDVVALEAEFSDKRYDKALTLYVKDVIARVESTDVGIQELVALHRIITDRNSNLTQKQINKVMHVVHNRLVESDFTNKVVRIGNDLMRITPESTVDNIEFENIDTGEFTVMPVHDALMSIDEVIEDDSVYKKNDVDTDISDEDSYILKQAYSEVFNTFTKSINDLSDIKEEELSEAIIEELNKC